MYGINEADKSALQYLQNKGMRLILKCNRYTKIESMLEVLNWMCVRKRLEYNTFIFVYKLKNNILPVYFSKFMYFNNNVHNFNTRNKDNFSIGFKNKTSTQKSVFCFGLRKFDELPNAIKGTHNLSLFKRKCAKYILSMTV